jgi:DNA-binding response OmpR family regulator
MGSATPRVLVADDDALAREMVAGLLRREGYEVELAAGGESAWTILQRPDAPQLAIVDWDMPGLDGIEVCRRVRGLQTSTRIYIIVLTSRDTAEDCATALAAGADDYVVKPPSPSELLARIRVGARAVASQED